MINQFEAQKNRGRQGFGIFDRECTRLVRATKERKILGWLRNHPSKSLMMHHRFPTSTDNVKNACHPFSTKNQFDTNYVLIHNGHISNSRDLKKEHEKLGIKYYSIQKDGRFNDSEALLWDVALYLEGKQDKLTAYGGIAFICLAIPKDKRKATQLHFGRNTNPLNMTLDEGMVLLSSEGAGEEIKRDVLHSFNYKTKKLTTKDLAIPGFAPYLEADWDSASSEWENGYTPGARFDVKTRRWITPQHVRTQVPLLPTNSGFHATHAVTDQANTNEQIRKYFDTTEDFLILPQDEDFSYTGIFGEDMLELVFENNKGTLLNIKEVIAERVDQYLEMADGYYKGAFSAVEIDIKAYRDMAIEESANGMEEDEDLILELDILAATKTTLTTSPFWVSMNSYDPSYEDYLTDSIKTYLQQQAASRGVSVRQNRLTAF